ncbi:MAG: DUF5057 domain-containing protein [Clostridia bacterium]|nr:DUF5057 domain-containing protein [Clostridia bacterium]
MKGKIKMNFSKHILPAITSVVAFSLMVLLIVLTRKPEQVSGDVIVNGKRYSPTNKMTILEIVSDRAFDELGPLIGDEYGAISWNAIKSKVPGGTLNSSNTDVVQAMVDYLMYLNESALHTGNTGYAVCIKYNNVYRYGNNYSSLFGTDTSVNVNDIQLCLCTKNTDGTYSAVLTEDKRNIRDVFSYFVFGRSDLEGCVQLKIMTPSEINKSSNPASIIDEAALIYFSSKSHTGYLKNKYSVITGKSWPSSDQINWDLGTNDLKAETALYLLMLNTRKGKAIMYNSTDKSSGSNGYSNISRILLTLSGIERNRFVADFAYKTPIRYNETEYEGNVGSIKIQKEGGYNVINYYVGDEKATINSDGPFAYWNKYLNLIGGTGNTYPVFNATENRKQEYLDKYTWEFNSNNSITSDWLLTKIYPDNAAYRDATEATTYQEAAKLTESNTVVGSDFTGAKAVEYIMGAYKSAPSGEVKVLEIQPIGVYGYDTAAKANKIKTWFGLPEDDASVSIKVTSVSMNAFIGLNEDILATYDLVFVGTQGSGKIDNDVFGTLYNTGKANSSNPYYSLNGNDFTDKAYQKIVKFAKCGMPVALESNVFNGNTDFIDNNTNVYKLRIYNLMDMLSSSGYSNIVNIESDLSSSDILNYIVKPKCSVIPTGVTEYNYSRVSSGTDTLNPRSVLSDLQFNGQITAKGECTVNIYLDVDCDSIFSDDEKYYKCIRTFSPNVETNFTTTASERIKGIPSNIPGYVSYKVELIDSNGLKDDCIGAFALDPGTNKRTVKVLEIMPEKDGKIVKSNLNLTDSDGNFRKKFSEVESITGLRLSVDVMSKKEFSDAIKNNTIDLDLYSMLVLGFCDNYGKIDNTNLTSEAVGAIQDFINIGKSVLMTHDTMSYTKADDSEAVATKESEANSLINYKKDSLSPYFRTYIGMKKDYQFTDTLTYKRNKLTPFSWYNDSYSDKSVRGNENDTSDSFAVVNDKTKMTNSVAQLNKGEITSYPYAITGEIGSEIPVAGTHGQYFPLDLELGDTETTDVVVWYTLTDPTVTSTNSDDYVKYYPHDISKTTDLDKINASKGYFGYFGQDAMNNYYIYSYGNVTYSSAGHSSLDGAGNDMEMQLFVNTFTRAILAGNIVPDVNYTDAALDESVTDYKGYVKYNYSKFMRTKLSFKFKIEDADFVTGATNVNAFFYLYYDSVSSSSSIKGVYKEGDASTTFLGYINGVTTKTVDGETVNCVTLAPSSTTTVPANVVESGKEYMIENLWDIVTDPEMKKKIIEGTVKIGIQATNSQRGKGYSILRCECRDLFTLD